MLHIHQSNHCETLTALLLRRLGTAPDSVFEAHTVIVPSAAMRRWLTLGLAEHQRICANVRFDYLAQWLWAQIARLVDGVAEQSPFAPARLTWRILAALGDAAFVGPQPRLAAYLAHADEVMRYELAAALAQLFDRYLVYRGDWLQAWAEGRDALPSHPDQHWQAALWRRLIAELGMRQAHPAADFIAALRRGGSTAAQAAGVPRCVHVFALPTIAPQHLLLLRQLAQAVDVHLYVLNPCEAYWFDLVSPARLARLAAHARDAAHEVGHPLLAAWGRQTQAGLELLLDDASQPLEDDAHFVAPAATTMLGRLQRDILELRATAPGSMPAAAHDRSIEIHRCHSLVRELDVLHDHLLGLFADDPTLQPADIVVLAPDLDSAAPLIDALFGTMPPARHLPYSISGARGSEDAPTRMLLDLLALPGSRFTAAALYALLQRPIVARRFGLDDESLRDVHDWMRDSGMRWALDAAHRADFELPAQSRHTLGDGLHRLFLGYALPPTLEQPFADRWPAGDAAGSRAAALGALWCFVQALRTLHEQLHAPLTSAQWALQLNELLDTFMQPQGEQIEQLAALRRQLGEFTASLQQPIALPVLRTALAAHLRGAGGGGVPGGRITFAALGSLRTLPYQVVCVIGMNDGAWPARQPGDEFDLMTDAPRRGDRLRRDEQRNQFLDALLAARHSLYLSFSGRSVRDNSTLPPSPLLDELLDVLVPAIAADPHSASALAAARQRLVVDHPLQAFSIDAFRDGADPRVRSFNCELADAARRSAALPFPTAPAAADAGVADRADEQGEDEGNDDEASAAAIAHAPFFVVPLQPADPEWRDVTLPQLSDFFRNPCRFLLRRRLGIELQRDEEPLADDEPFIADWLSRQALAARLLPRLLMPRPPLGQALQAMAEAGAELPGGAVGRRLLEAELEAMQGFAARLRADRAAPCAPEHSVDLAFDIDGEAWRLRADLGELRAAGAVGWRYDALRAGDVLQAWLQHLLLCASPPAGVEPASTWHATDCVLRLEAPQSPVALLHTLLRLYRSGLHEPLHFFPKSAWAYAQAGRSLQRATRVWTPSARQPFAEGADPYYRLALRGLDMPLDERFTAAAEAVFMPLLECADSATPAP